MTLVLVAKVSAEPISALQPDDCAKCHSFQLKLVKAGGGQHATAVGCLDCHPQHPPEGKNSQTACGLCHEGEPHYQLDDCRQCHAVAHQPLESLRDPLKPTKQACLTCNAEVGETMVAAPSRHGELFCNRCHEQHGQSPDCLDCHAGHLDSQLGPDCLRCHSAHQPLQVNPIGQVPTGFCRACHESQTNDLAATNTNHGAINCVYCHEGQHPAVPTCQDCHGLPHAQSIHAQFGDCLQCHGDAHRLVSGK